MAFLTGAAAPTRLMTMSASSENPTAFKTVLLGFTFENLPFQILTHDHTQCRHDYAEN
jgi:hypothetical protein